MRPRTSKSILAGALAALLATSCGSGEPLMVRVMYPLGGLGDRSFADSVYEGVRRAKLDASFEAVQAAPLDPAEASALLDEWVTGSSGPQLIVLVGSGYLSLVKERSCAVGGSWVLGLDVPDSGCPGVATVEYLTFAPAFMAGVAAMQVSEKKKAAVIAGRSIEEVDRFVRGFEAGVRHAGGAITAVEYLAEDDRGFNDPAGAGEVATRLFSEADVIFPVAGGSGMGVIAAANEAPGRYVLGVDHDQSWLSRGVVIGSVVKQLGNTVQRRIEAALDGRFEPGAVRLGLHDEAVDFVANELFASKIDAAVASAREAALAAEEADLARGGAGP